MLYALRFRTSITAPVSRARNSVGLIKDVYWILRWVGDMANQLKSVDDMQELTEAVVCAVRSSISEKSFSKP